MNKLSVTGFPRIGANRELKKLVESYIKGNISKEDLTSGSIKLKETHWHILKENKIDYIPSNDFSFYDTILDAAFALNIIPERYKNAGLDELNTYFAMAKGRQDKNNDLKALNMKKWFNTNYHYIVPEIDDSIEIKLNSKKIINEYIESKNTGIKTKPVITGPLTFLKLIKIKNPDKNYCSYIDKIVNVYIELLEKLNNAGAEFIQIDEPVLVTDMNEEDFESFLRVYNKLLPQKRNIKVLLQTYFGDIRDFYKEIIKLDFDALGLDFIEGKSNTELIKKYGFPENMLLFAGVVNGKNIWINNYNDSLNTLKELSQYVKKDKIVLSTSCSLLHVPYSLRYETKMDKNIKRNFAFAEEKLNELNDLSELFNDDNFLKNDKFIKNQSIILEKNKTGHFYFKDVRNKIKSLLPGDFIRLPNYTDRAGKQKEILNLPLLPTTTIGSFPQTKEIRKLRNNLKKNLISYEEYKDKIKLKIKYVISLQEEIGLDVLVHGEFERNDMVEYFGSNLEGFVFTESGWVQSYGTRGVKPPIIFGDIKREKPITLEWITYAQSLTKKPVKGMLTGPVTILNWSFPREDIPLKETAYQIALAIKEEVLDLEKAGIKIIQIDEAALREKLPLRKENWNKDYLDWAIKAFQLVHSSVRPETQIHTHMCYSEFSDIISKIKEMDADVITIESAKSNLSLLDSLKDNHYDKDIGPGVYDIHSSRIPPIEEFTDIITKIAKKIDITRIWVNPDCGLKTREFSEVIPSLTNMVNAAKKIRQDRKMND